MGFRKVSVRQSVADSIAEISWYLESEGLLATAEKFSDEAYDFLTNLGHNRKSYRPCREPERNAIGYKMHCLYEEIHYRFYRVKYGNHYL
jgi:hypothetical protein